MSIESLRARFNEEVEKNPDLYHPVDIERVRTETWQVKRFLDEFDGDEDKAFELLVKAMRWKKEIGLHDRTDQYYPKEFYELSGSEISGRDKQNRVIQLESLKRQHSFKELSEASKMFLAHNIERVDRLAGEDGFILLTDTNGAGISNIDMDMMKYKIAINEFYPGGLRQMFVIDLPWLLNPIMKIIVGFMNPSLQSKMTYVKRSQLNEYINESELPVHLNGKRDKQVIPNDVECLENCYQRFDLTDKFVDQFYSYHKLKRAK